MHDQFRDRASFYIVYIAEAHAVDEWQLRSNEQEGIRLMQHSQFEERLAAAELCAQELGLQMPTLVDEMDNAVSTLFAAWPERIYILDKGGTVYYRGGYGPYEFNPAEARLSLMALLQQDSR
jgi:hypothetical protein